MVRKNKANVHVKCLTLEHSFEQAPKFAIPVIYIS